MSVVGGAIPGLRLFTPRVLRDARGTFQELYHAARYAEAGVAGPFVQDNLSRSVRHTLRGLHMQHPSGQGKLVMALEGEVFDVAVDLRRGSPTFGQWRSFVLTEHNAHQVYVPPGFAHGFLVLSRVALFAYKCTALYSPSDEIIVRWDDPALGISWPDVAPLLSPKDRDAPPLSRIPLDRLPTFEGES